MFSVPGITARYAHVPDRALVAAADQVSDRIDGALAGKTGAEVIEFDPRRVRVWPRPNRDNQTGSRS